MLLLDNVLVLLTILLPQALSRPLNSQTTVYADDSPAQESFQIPSRYTSTLLARRLLALSPTGVLSTIFPPSSTHSLPTVFSSPPSSVASAPIALPDYLADCENSGNPTLLALSVSTSTRNAIAGSNVSLSISWWDTYSRLTHHDPWSAANLPRASLIGYLEEMSEEDIKLNDIVACYTGVHRDSRLWLPGDSSAAHEGVWMRLIVQEVYWIGGFGDRNFIGWFDVKEWRDVRKEDWEKVKLPGEV
jgi:hypothetical protein